MGSQNNQQMKMKFHLPLLLIVSLILTFSFESCTEPGTSDSTTIDTNVSKEESTDTMSDTNTETETKEKKHSEMTTQEHSNFVAQHADHLTFVNEKMIEIKTEHVKKKDYFTFECESGKVSLERHYNDADEVHLLTYTQSLGDAISAKHHFFWENKLIYQFYHHEVKEGDKFVVDDHKTFFKDGEMLKCLEKKYSYINGEAKPNVPYELVDCVQVDKLTKDIEKLLISPEDEAKALFCK